MGFKGSVESFSLADVFQNLAMNQQTGTLRVYNPIGGERLVYFQEGNVRSLSMGVGKPLVRPEVYVARGYLSANLMAEALSAARDLSRPTIDLLLEQGVLTSAQVGEVTKAQIEEEIYELFRWEKANFEFDAGPSAQGVFTTQSGAATVALPISQLIMEAARRVDEWERLRKLVPSTKEIYTLDPAARKAIDKGEMEADPIEKRVAALIDCARDVDDLVEDSFLFRFEIVSALTRLMQSSLARLATLQELTQAEQECLRRNEPRRRIKVLERILAAGGEDPRVRRDLAEALAAEGRIDTACIHFSLLAETEQQNGRLEPAIELHRRILMLLPEHVKAHEQLAAIYAKRGQKREAFVHYNMLFENFREQNHPREARAAATAALECDPSRAELRASLIELLLADNQKEAAAQQYEVQGDQNARAGNVRLAADSYRHAMQLAPANKQLKKKLADVMLTKEDRLARKRRARLLLLAAIFLAVMAGGLAFKEHQNGERFEEAQRAAEALEQKGAECETEGNYGNARAAYDAAGAIYSGLAANLFSPLRNLEQQAKQATERLSRLAADAQEKADKYRDANTKRSDDDLEAAANKFHDKQVYEARDLYRKVLDNGDSPRPNRLAATEGLNKTQELIDAYEKAKKRLESRAWPNIESEAAEVREILVAFQGFPGFDPSKVEMPLLIEPDTSGVEVFLDGRPVGTINLGKGLEANTFRYPAVGVHRFEFRKAGFKTVTLTVTPQNALVYALRMEREPVVRMDLRAALGADVKLSGEAVLGGESFFAGTSEGGLLEIREGERAVVRSYALPQGGGLNSQVYGPIYLHKRGAETVIVYCTRSGACIGLKATGGGFEEAWPMVKAKEGQAPLSARPSIIQLKYLGAPAMALPLGTKLHLVDCDTGQPAAGSPLDFAATITSSATGLEQQGLIVAGVKEENTVEPKLYGFSLLTKAVSHKWNPGLDKVFNLRAKPVLFEDKVVIGGTNGCYYLFDIKNQNIPAGFVVLEGAGDFDCEPLITGSRLIAGTATKEGFWCVDLVRHQAVWGFLRGDMGGTNLQPAALGNTVYFATDKGRLLALDAAKGWLRWAYQVEGGTPLISRPLVSGKRVYVVSAEGKIIGFEE